MDNKKNFKLSLLYPISIIMIIAMIIVFFNNNTKIGFNNEDAIEFDDGWYYLNKSGEKIDIESLPAKIDIVAGEDFSFRHVVPKESFDGRSMMLRSSFQKILVTCGGDTLYTFMSDTLHSTNNSPGSITHIFRIPDKYSGQELVITQTSKFSAFSGKINPVFIGTKSALIYHLWRLNLTSAIIAITLFVIGLVLLFSHIVICRKLNYDKLLYLAFFFIFISIWLLDEAEILQSILNDSFLITRSSFVFLALAPIPFAAFVEKSYKPHHKSAFSLFTALFIFNSAISFILHTMGILDFFVLLPVINATTAVYLVYLIISLIYEIKVHKNADAEKILAPILIPVITTFVELIATLGGNYNSIGKLSQYGFLCYLSVLVYLAAIDIEIFSDEYHEKLYLEKLAFTDVLTLSFNRTAFEQDIKEVLNRYNKNSETGFWLCLFDLNGLKWINDNMGHISGDNALVSAYRCICDSFGAYGKVYRVGGDEFACVITDELVDLNDLNRAQEYMEHLSFESSKKTEYVLSIAAGFDCYNAKKYTNFDEFYHIVDLKMYQNKRETNYRR